MEGGNCNTGGSLDHWEQIDLGDGGEPDGSVDEKEGWGRRVMFRRLKYVPP